MPEIQGRHIIRVPRWYFLEELNQGLIPGDNARGKIWYIFIIGFTRTQKYMWICVRKPGIQFCPMKDAMTCWATPSLHPKLRNLTRSLTPLLRMLLEKSFQSYFAILKWKRWQDQQAYAHVDIAGGTDSGELEPRIPSPSKGSSKRQLLVYTILIYMILSSIILLHLAFSAFFYNKIRNPLSSNAKPDSTIMFSPCGSTPSEARAASCVFDIVAFSWLPPRCHDAELGEEFRQQKDW